MKIRKGDTVEIIRGDDRGSRGNVHRVLPDLKRVVVSGVNMIKKHQRRTGDVRTQVGIIEREAPVAVSNVALVCPRCNKPTRVGYLVSEDGTKVRVCRKCDETIE
jgi:large subunit ribosomal protein L24